MSHQQVEETTPVKPNLQVGVAPEKKVTLPITQKTNHEAAIRLLDEWMADESGYDEAVWPIVKQDLEDNRLSSRRKFVD